MRLTVKLMLCALLILAGYLAGAGFVWPGWPAVQHARSTATAQVGDTEQAVAAIATQEVQNAIDQQDWGKWNMELDGMVGASTVIAAETTRLAAVEHDLAIRAALLTPTPAPVATQADIAGAGATFVPTVSSGKIEIVAWGGPFGEWVPVIVVNGSSQPVVIDDISIWVDNANIGSGQFFAPALLLPGERTIGTLRGTYPAGLKLTLANFKIVSKTPGDRDAKVNAQFDGEPVIDPSTNELSMTIDYVDRGGRNAEVAKGVCLDAAGNVTGLYWIDLRGKLNINSSHLEISDDFEGSGPCELPLIGLAT